MRKFFAFALVLLVLVLSSACLPFTKACEGEEVATPSEVDRENHLIIFSEDDFNFGSPLPEFATGTFKAVTDINRAAPGSVSVVYFLRNGEQVSETWPITKLDGHGDQGVYEFDAHVLNLLSLTEELHIAAASTPLLGSSFFLFCMAE